MIVRNMKDINNTELHEKISYMKKKVKHRKLMYEYILGSENEEEVMRFRNRFEQCRSFLFDLERERDRRIEKETPIQYAARMVKEWKYHRDNSSWIPLEECNGKISAYEDMFYKLKQEDIRKYGYDRDQT